MPYVYADLVLAVNLVMNYVLLLLTATFAQECFIAWRLISGSLLGALYALLVLLYPLSFLQLPLLKILVSLAMVWLVFGYRDWRHVLRLMAYFYLLSFLLGGATLASFYFLSGPVQVSRGALHFVTAEVPWWSLLVAVVLVALGGQLAWTVIRCRIWQEPYCIQLRLCFQGSWVEVPALVDTGNQLWDPISHNPVIVVETAALAQILPSEIQAISVQGKPDLSQIASVDDPDWARRCRLIPFSGLGAKKDLLFAVRPDEIYLFRAKVWKRTRPALVALVNQSLCVHGPYRALVHPALLEV